MRILVAALVIRAKWQMDHMPLDRLMGKLRHINTKEYYFAIKRNEGLIHVATIDDFGNLVLGERCQKSHLTSSHLYEKYPK